MRTWIVVLAAGLALAGAGQASAGCWATVGLHTPVSEPAAGGTWPVELTVLQHGRTPLPEARPTVVVAGEGGEVLEFPATLVDPAAARFRAEVVFPSAGAWSVAVHDGFPWGEQCAQTHTFGTHAVAAAGGPPGTGGRQAAPEPPPAAVGGDAGPEGGGSLVLPLALGLGLGGIGLATATALRSRRRRVVAPL